MALYPRLREPAIVEAVVELRPSRVLAPEQIDLFVVRAAHEFPNATPLVRQEIQLGVPIGIAAPRTVTTIEGKRLDAADRRRVILAGHERFVMSHLAPYLSWEALSADARRWWEEYRALGECQDIARCSVRAINRLHIPEPEGEVGRWMTLGPMVPAELPKTVSACLMRLQIELEADRAFAIVTTRWEPEPPVAGTRCLAILFDIDVVSELAMPATGDELWDRLDKLHDWRNEIFFKSLTETMKGTMA